MSIWFTINPISQSLSETNPTPTPVPAPAPAVQEVVSLERDNRLDQSVLPMLTDIKQPVLVINITDIEIRASNADIVLSSGGITSSTPVLVKQQNQLLYVWQPEFEPNWILTPSGVSVTHGWRCRTEDGGTIIVSEKKEVYDVAIVFPPSAEINVRLASEGCVLHVLDPLSDYTVVESSGANTVIGGRVRSRVKGQMTNWIPSGTQI